MEPHGVRLLRRRLKSSYGWEDVGFRQESSTYLSATSSLGQGASNTHLQLVRPDSWRSRILLPKANRMSMVASTEVFLREQGIGYAALGVVRILGGSARECQ